MSGRGFTARDIARGAGLGALTMSVHVGGEWFDDDRSREDALWKAAVVGLPAIVVAIVESRKARREDRDKHGAALLVLHRSARGQRGGRALGRGVDPGHRRALLVFTGALRLRLRRARRVEAALAAVQLI